MHVASLELSKELYELSGWEETHLYHTKRRTVKPEHHGKEYFIVELKHKTSEPMDRTPAYDLGYLLRKLPGNSWAGYCGEGTEDNSGIFKRSYAEAYTYKWEPGGDIFRLAETMADIPENATCKLAIELFKIGVLTKEPEQSSSSDKS
jgi:hypothetical protein